MTIMAHAKVSSTLPIRSRRTNKERVRPNLLNTDATAARYFLVVLLAMVVWKLEPQLVRADQEMEICGCSPSNYTFVLDFSLFCPPIQVGRGNGISSTSCIISPLGAPSSDLEPVTILNVDILELDQNNNVLTEERIQSNFQNGETISYTSILGRPNSVVSLEDIPSAFQMNLNGVNAEGVALINVFVISFTNECGILPVLDPGESAGWAVIDNLGFPNLDFCSTFSPTESPTESPTSKPTVVTATPTRDPTPNPTRQPTPAPVTDDPSASPTQEPTPVPITGAPTPSPVEDTRSPTDAPVTIITEAPTPIPTSEEPPVPSPRTDGPTFQPTTPPPLQPLSPTPRPTPRPTILPTVRPTPPPLPTPALTVGPSVSAIPTVFSMSMDLTGVETADLRSLQLLEEELDMLDQFWN